MKTMKNFVKVISFIFFFLVWASSEAQTWEKKLNTDSFDFLKKAIPLADQKTALISIHINPNNSFLTMKSRIVILDRNGSIVKERWLKTDDFIPGTDTSLNFLHTTDGSYNPDSMNLTFFATVRLDTPETTTNLFYKLDSNLNLLSFNYQDTLIDSSDIVFDMKYFGDQSYFIGFSSGSNSSRSVKAFLGQVDDSLNFTMKKLRVQNSTDTVILYSPGSFLMDNKKQFYVFSDGIFPSTSRFTPLQLVKLDSNLKLLKRTFISHPLQPNDFQLISAPAFTNAHWIDDNTFFLVASAVTGGAAPPLLRDIHMFIYSKDFIQQQYKRLFTPNVSEFFASTGSLSVYDSLCDCFYIGVTRRFTGSLVGTCCSGDTTDFQLIKVDKKLNVLFNKYYRRNKTLNVSSITTDQKGNVILAGEASEINPVPFLDNDVFILKVDSLGNLNSPVGLPESETEINRLNFRFFPNPSKGLVNFRQYNVMEDYRMDLYDSQGRLLQQYRLQNSDNSIDLSDYPKGVYLYRLTDSKGRRASGKLVRE